MYIIENAMEGKVRILEFVKYNLIELILIALIVLVEFLDKSIHFLLIIPASLLVVLIINRSRWLGILFGVCSAVLSLWAFAAFISELKEMIHCHAKWDQMQPLLIGGIMFSVSLGISSFLFFKKYATFEERPSFFSKGLHQG
jgi:hypothetical protein